MFLNIDKYLSVTCQHKKILVSKKWAFKSIYLCLVKTLKYQTISWEKKVCQNNVKMMHYLSMTKACEKHTLWKKKAYLKKVFFEMHLKSMLDIFPVLISMYCENTSLLWFISFIRLPWNSSLYQTSLASSKVFRDYVVCNKTSILKAVSLKSDIKFQTISFKTAK